MRWLCLVNVALALAGAHRLRLRSPFGPRRHVRLRTESLVQTHARSAAATVPELAQLNTALAARLRSADLKARECALLHEAFLQSPAASESRARSLGDLSLSGVRRDLASATTGLARVEEAEAEEDTAENCAARRVAGESALATLQRQLANATAAKVSGAATDDLYETVLGRLGDRVALQRATNGKVAAACQQLIAERNLEQERIRQKKEFLYAKLAASMSHLGAAEEPLPPSYDHVRQCLADLQELRVAADEVKRNRAAVLAAEAVTLTVADCEVTDWIEESCSASCGGGTRIVSRSVVSPAENGAACPVLSLHEHCSPQACPEDCATGDWSGWSSCVEVKSRLRQVERAGNALGAPCGALQQTVVCAGAEDQCVLGEWSEWSGCSRACGGGSTRARRGASEACGRVEVDRVALCNAFPCEQDQACADAERPVFILDGSGSLGAERFKALSKLAGDTAKLLPEVAVLLAGADVTDLGGGWQLGRKAAKKANRAKYPESATSLPAAFEHGLGLGARTLVVFTDGQVNSQLAMAEASARAQARGGRVVVVAPELAAAGASGYASQPVHDNVLAVSMQALLDRQQCGNACTLVSMLCRELA